MSLEKKSYISTPNVPQGSYDAGLAVQYSNLAPPGAQGYAQSNPPIYSATSNPHPDGRRLLHIYHHGLTRRHIQILDSDKATPLYNVNSNSGSVFSSKPHIRIQNAMTGAEVGSVTFRSFSSSMDLTVHGRDFTFDKPRIFTTTHEFRSLATGQTLKWKRDGMFAGGDLKCVNERGELYALFEISLWAMSKDGKFELGPAVQGPLMDEIVVSGIAAVEFHRRQRRSSAGGGGGS